MRICILHQYQSQEKVSGRIREELNSYDVSCVSVEDDDAIDAFINIHCFDFDVIILTLGGGETQHFHYNFRRKCREKVLVGRPYIISMTVGVILDKVFFGTFSAREASDAILVNRGVDVSKVQSLLYAMAASTANSAKVLPCLCPIYDSELRKDIDYSAPINKICFAVQTDVPRSLNERRYVAKQLVSYAKRHPDRIVLVKPKHRLGETSAHPQKYPYEKLLQEFDCPNNVQITHESMVDLIKDCDLIISISSTALIESMFMGKRASAILDFGVKEALGTTYFVGSGILNTFEEIISDQIKPHNAEWLAREFDAPAIKDTFDTLLPEIALANGGHLSHRVSEISRLQPQREMARAERVSKSKRNIKPKSHSRPSSKEAVRHLGTENKDLVIRKSRPRANFQRIVRRIRDKIKSWRKGVRKSAVRMFVRFGLIKR